MSDFHPAVTTDRKESVGGYICIATLLYVMTYWILMIRYFPPVDESGVDSPVYRSSARIGPSMPIANPVTFNRSKVSILNYIFYPADLVFYALSDSIGSSRR